MSNSRRQIEAWLKTLDIKGDVADVGGLFWPVKGRTKSWDVKNYHIWDIKKSRNGVESTVVCDFNKPLPLYMDYDHIFCIEATDHFWNPYQAFQNMYKLGRYGSRIYVSSNFLFPHHTGFDCMRFTSTGLEKLLTETGFRVLDITPRRAAIPDLFSAAMGAESPVQYHRGEIGYMITAERRNQYGITTTPF